MILLSNLWQFYKDDVGQWQWRKFQNKKVITVSTDSFRTRKACVDDAKTRGYAVTEGLYAVRNKQIETGRDPLAQKTPPIRRI